MKNAACQPIDGAPDADEVIGLVQLPAVQVTMVTYCDPRTGNPVWLQETFTDPEDGLQKIVWSRVTESLAYVRG